MAVERKLTEREKLYATTFKDVFLALVSATVIPQSRGTSNQIEKLIGDAKEITATILGIAEAEVD